ncbi:MAG TPA: M56 family metallopeptidase [Rhizomicrobium sp.]|nr:M56 family metallopeptidase [Rhizomicrobium sp.]
MTASLSLLLDAALRASVLGLAVALLLKLARLHDARAEIPIWTAVLLAAMAMPLLCTALPSRLAVPLPHIALGHAAAASNPAALSGPILVLQGQGSGMALIPAAAASSSAWDWLLHHGLELAGPIYGLVLSIQLMRLAVGLLLTMRLYRAAMPIAAPWAAGRAIRASAAVAGPFSFGHGILLPADYADWPHKKLLAVLAHEQSHIGRGDFFIQLLANLHRAIFWFSPFAWWLQARLCALAEAASDEEAVRCLSDRATYAEILVEISRCAHGLPVQVAMAKGPAIHWRIDRILSEKTGRRLGLAARLGAVGAIVPAALIVAAAHTAVPRTPALPRLVRAAQSTIPIRPAIPVAKPAVAAQSPRHARPVHRVARQAHSEPVAAIGADAEVTYNPRALLDNQAVAILPAVLFTGNSANR